MVDRDVEIRAFHFSLFSNYGFGLGSYDAIRPFIMASEYSLSDHERLGAEIEENIDRYRLAHEEVERERLAYLEAERASYEKEMAEKAARQRDFFTLEREAGRDWITQVESAFAEAMTYFASSIFLQGDGRDLPAELIPVHDFKAAAGIFRGESAYDKEAFYNRAFDESNRLRAAISRTVPPEVVSLIMSTEKALKNQRSYDTVWEAVEDRLANQIVSDGLVADFVCEGLFDYPIALGLASFMQTSIPSTRILRSALQRGVFPCGLAEPGKWNRLIVYVGH